MSNPSHSLVHRLYQALPLRVRLRHECAHLLRTEEELALVADLLTSSSTLVDVGANIGSYVGVGVLARAQVTAVEPLPDLAQALREKFGTRVRVIQAACASQRSSATLYVPYTAAGRRVDTRSSLLTDANDGFESRPVTVDLLPLDDMCASADVVKIDVEGFEAQVLESGRALLESSTPAVLVEVERRHHANDPWRAFAILESFGYEGWFLAPGRCLTPLSQFMPDVHQPVDVAKDPSSSARPEGYVNNFLFLHPARPDQRARLSSAGWVFASGIGSFTAAS